MKHKKNMLWLLLIIAMLKSNLIAQPTLYSYDYNINQYDQYDYSILELDDGLIMAGTLWKTDMTDPNSEASIHVLKLDNNGNIVWNKTYDAANYYSTCFNINYADDGFILTGKVFDVQTTTNYAYLLKINTQGGITDQKYYTNDILKHSTGLYVVKDEEYYVMVGFTNYKNLDATDDKQAMVIKVNQALDVQWSKFLNTPKVDNDYDMAEHIIVIPAYGYFITGSVNVLQYDQNGQLLPFSYQGALACMLDFSGNLSWFNSYNASNVDETSTSSVFDPSNDMIYCLSNNSVNHNIAMATFDLNGNMNDYYVYGPFENFAGYHIMLPYFDNSKLMVAGFYRDKGFTTESGSYYGNQLPALLQLEKGSLDVDWVRYYGIVSPNISGNGNFFHFNYQFPKYFSPRIATVIQDGYAFVAYTTATANNNVELVVNQTETTGDNDCVYFDDNFTKTATVPVIIENVNISEGAKSNNIGFNDHNIALYRNDCEDCKLSAAFTYSQYLNNVYFLDQSIAGANTYINSWTWDFGDGTGSTTQSPSHTYLNPGTYTVCLTIDGININGDPCQEVYCEDIEIKCQDFFEPGFNWSATGCTVNFTNQTTSVPGLNLLSYWHFGDGSTSTMTNPSHTYAGSGTYQVCLVISTSVGNVERCVDSICMDVTVSCTSSCQVNANFNFSVAEGQNYAIASFYNQSTTGAGTTITGYYWSFGDGTTSTLQNPTHNYPYSGSSYNVCLTVYGSNGGQTCSSTSCTYIYIPIMKKAINREPESQSLVYPNPNTGKFTVKLNEDLPSFIKITDNFGRVIREDLFVSTGTTEIDLSAEPKGIYILTIRNSEKTLIEKIVIN